MTFAAKLKLLIAGATPGPWIHVARDNLIYSQGHKRVIICVSKEVSQQERDDNSAFVTYLANHAADIVALVEAAAKVNSLDIYYPAHERLRAALTALNKDT